MSPGGTQEWCGGGRLGVARDPYRYGSGTLSGHTSTLIWEAVRLGREDSLCTEGMGMTGRENTLYGGQQRECTRTHHGHRKEVKQYLGIFCHWGVPPSSAAMSCVQRETLGMMTPWTREEATSCEEPKSGLY